MKETFPEPGMDLFVRRIDENAKWQPHHTLVRFPDGLDWETDGYRSLTWQQYADAINKTAYWLDETFGRCINNETVAYYGPSDIRYAILFAASVKTGRKLLVPDGRLMNDGLGQLLRSVECVTWLYSAGGAFSPESELEASGVRLQQFPSLEWCLAAGGTKQYPYEKTYEEAKNDEILIIHTGGTTGAPKPIVMNNGFWSAGCSFAGLARRHWPRGLSSDTFYGRSVILAIPMRFLAGHVLINMYAVFYNTSVVVPPADEIGLPPGMFKKLLRLNKVDGLVAFPFTIVDLYNNEECQNALRSLDSVTYLGAALDRTVGDGLCMHTRLSSVIGATESGGRFSLDAIDRRLWYTFQFIPEHHVRMEKVENSGALMGNEQSSDVYLSFIDRPPGGNPSIYQCAFWNYRMFTDIDSIDTKELWKPVLDSDGSTRWEFIGRSDDWTKLIWMAKFNAQDIETRVSRYPGVKHVMVGGMGQAAPFILIEGNEDLLSKEGEGILDEIYEKVILAINKDSVEEVEIPRETMIIAKVGKPIKLTAKQLVSRREVETDYREEIEAAYERLRAANKSMANERFLKYTR
ncbi:hypothetical protein AB5N19_00099 [Seiridium cardinale]